MKTEVLRELRSIVGTQWCLDSPADLIPYSYDATPAYQHVPDVVVLPASTEEVAAIMKVAYSHRIPVVPRGAGSCLSAGAVPLQGGIVLAMNRMDRIKEIDQENMTATFEAGVVTARLHQAVEAVGLFYPPDPGSMATSTMGGNIAECAGGLRGLKYGVTKDYIIGVEAVLPDGRILRAGGKNAKDVAGYDLVKLLVGSEGTLAVITEATAKLLPLPEAKRTAMALFRDLKSAARSVSRIIANRIIPVTLEFMDNATIRVVEEYARIGLPVEAGALLLMQQDGPEAICDRDIDRMAAICREEGAFDVRRAHNAEEESALMEARRTALSALARKRPTVVLEDVTVPRSHLAEMVEMINATAAKYGVLICTFGHAGDGNLHPTCLTDERDREEMERVERAFDEIYDYALRLGGTLTGEHGVGAAKAPYLEWRMGETGMDLMKRIKEAFDPYNLLNPGKLFGHQTRRRVVVRS
ncbi:MAG TPA: FAD-linked oxidase C-terminal domain-containing protein [Symbiobacteriaceae bacterium]